MVLLSVVTAYAVWLPTSDTTQYVVLNHGRVAGDMTVAGDARTKVVRYQYVDRYSPATRLETRYAFSPAGTLLSADVRRFFSPAGLAGEVVEYFSIAGDSARWGSGPQRGRSGNPPGAQSAASYDSNAFYRPELFTPFDQALLARFLLQQPRRTARLWPRGSVRLDIVADTAVQSPAGPIRLRLAILFYSDGPVYGVWLDAHDELFADQAGWFITVRRGGESALPVLRKIEFAHENARAEVLARQFARPVAGTLVIRNGDVFDSELGAIRSRTTVIVRGDRIVAVGPADSLAVPLDATVIDASGKTVIPGLWDMHVHTHLRAQTRASPQRLAAGITTVRDMAADVDFVVPHRDRAAAGLQTSPRLILAGFIEGPGETAGPTDAIVRSAEEARAWIARYDSLGYRQVKVYEHVPPDLVSGIAAEARQRGLRLSGHVPRGLRVPDVVRLGYQEITHIEFLFRALLPDSQQLPLRFGDAIIRGAVNVDGTEMTDLIELLRANRIVVEPTLNYYVPRFGARTSPAAWDSTFGRLVKRLHDAGVTLVAGTDAGAARYQIELELYERAGIPAAGILQIATINAARVMNEEARYGSIRPGKVADIVIVNGQPAERISDLAKVELVIRAGRVYNSAELRAAIARLP
jgi:imidazolonepropionase-like amidohydrolase